MRNARCYIVDMSNTMTNQLQNIEIGHYLNGLCGLPVWATLNEAQRDGVTAWVLSGPGRALILDMNEKSRGFHSKTLTDIGAASDAALFLATSLTAEIARLAA